MILTSNGAKVQSEPRAQNEIKNTSIGLLRADSAIHRDGVTTTEPIKPKKLPPVEIPRVNGIGQSTPQAVDEVILFNIPTGGKGGGRNSVLTKRTIRLPAITDVMDFLDEEIPEPPEIIEGILSKGSKLILSGGSKSRKTWALTHLALAAAIGESWWGFPTKPSRVLYINFEIQKGYYQRRVQSIKEKLVLDGTRLRGKLKIWNLRGCAVDISFLVEHIIAKAKDQYDLIILDPIYKVLGDRDENSNGDVASMMNEFDRIIEETGAAVAFAHHYSKGNQSRKNAMDRMSGAGAFARDADSLLMMTDHKQKDSYVIDAVLRNHRPVEQFCITTEHPVMVRDEQLDPKNVKTVGAKEKTYCLVDLMKVLNIQHLTSTELERQFIAATSASSGTFDNLLREAKASSEIEKCADGKKWKAVSPTFPIGYNACNNREVNGTNEKV